jgi:hypothetical protein
MKTIVKRVLGWDRKSDSEQTAFLGRYELLRYRLFWLASFVLCLVPIPLSLLLRMSLSDKHQPSEHQYGHTYGALFRRFKYRPIKLLEIGIGGNDRRLGGESLNAWQAYFPFARIIGCDIEDKRKLATPRTAIYRLDQSSREQLEELCRKEQPFDIIIDDGSHLSKHQLLSFMVLFPSLSPRGLYIIEDVQTSYWSGGWEGAPVASPQFGNTCVGYFLELTKYINHREFKDLEGADLQMLQVAKTVEQVIFEHNLIIVRKAAQASR